MQALPWTIHPYQQQKNEIDQWPATYNFHQHHNKNEIVYLIPKLDGPVKTINFISLLVV